MKKLVLYLMIGIIALCIINFWYQVYITGRYYENAGLFFTVIIGIIPALTIFGAYKSIIHIKTVKK